MIIFFIDFLIIIFILACACSLGYMILTNILNIIFGVICAIVISLLVFLLLKILKHFFPKTGWFLWYLTMVLLLISIVGGAYLKYQSYRVFVTTQDIEVVQHDGYYTYIENEESLPLHIKSQYTTRMTIPMGTELRTKDLYFKSEYNVFEYSSIASKKDSNQHELLIYGKKKVSLPYKFLDLIGQKPIIGDIEYK